MLITPFTGFPIVYIKYLANAQRANASRCNRKVTVWFVCLYGDNPRAKWFVRLFWGQYTSLARVLSSYGRTNHTITYTCSLKV